MIEIRRHRIILTKVNAEIKKKLSYKLGIWNKNRFSYSKLMFLELDNGTLAIPKHFPLKEFHYITGFDEKIYVNDFYKTKKSKFKMRPEIGWHPSNEEKAKIQKEAYNFLVINKEKPRKLLAMSTGYGKTFIAIKYITEFNHIPLIICNQLPLIKQWKKFFLQYTDIKEDDMKIISGSDVCEDIIFRDKYTDCQVYFVTHDTLNSLIKKNTSLLEKLFEKLKISIKVVDEAHKEFELIFKEDACCDVKESLFLTATPKRSKEEENKLLNYILPFDCMYTNQDKRSPNINVLVYTYTTKPTLEEETIISDSNGYGFSAAKWCDYVINNYWKDFSEGIIYNMKLCYKDKFRKTAILFKTKEMIFKFAEDLKKEFPDYSIGFFINHKGLVTKKNKLDELNKDIILTTDISFVEGMDTSGLSLVINTITFISDVIAIQVTGRIREKGLYIDYCDDGFRKTNLHRKSRIKVYQKIAKKIFYTKHYKEFERVSI